MKIFVIALKIFVIALFIIGVLAWYIVAEIGLDDSQFFAWAVVGLAYLVITIICFVTTSMRGTVGLFLEVRRLEYEKRVRELRKELGIPDSKAKPKTETESFETTKISPKSHAIEKPKSTTPNKGDKYVLNIVLALLMIMGIAFLVMLVWFDILKLQSRGPRFPGIPAKESVQGTTSNGAKLPSSELKVLKAQPTTRASRLLLQATVEAFRNDVAIWRRTVMTTDKEKRIDELLNPSYLAKYNLSGNAGYSGAHWKEWNIKTKVAAICYWFDEAEKLEVIEIEEILADVDNYYDKNSEDESVYSVIKDIRFR